MEKNQEIQETRRLKTNTHILKSVNSNFTLAIQSPKFGQAKTHLLSHLGKKREKIWLGQDLNP